MSKPAYRRVMIKVSGEALMGTETYGLHAPTIGKIAADLIEVRKSGVEVAVVVGGGYTPDRATGRQGAARR